MSLIQFIIFAFIAFVIFKVFSRFKEKNLTLRELSGWVVFWLVVAVIIALPQSTNFFARVLGVGRGTDVVIYVSIIILFTRFSKYKCDLRK